ncbi:hypothetical protein [Bythopirellula goksoeyrii]|uniref:Uncharacterized protein n=1 Tax=Bythopirellula goksoeyrii TaxID=1400387 RepID=A0A5B9QEE4_9BACT|nr:hypothetical protein [Bythopirellula goksoeyrii]QEG36249.1 hypothetical protein Pr1d_35610 [Bythopirellula goksoeyrii]
MAKKRPFSEAVRRRNIQGALWQNFDGNGNPFYTPSVTRSYKDQNDQWQNEVLHVPLDDIPRVIAVLQEMETKAYEQMQVDYATRSTNGDSEAQVPVGAGAAESDNF